MEIKNKIIRHGHFPPLGLRIIKTAAAVFICLVIYILRGYRGMASQSTIAAIICMQPYDKDSMRAAWNRIIGTVMGGIWGLLFLLLMQYAPHINSNMLLVYLFMTIGVAAVLYTCVALRISDSASLAAIVFLCVIITYPDVEAPLQQTFDRIFDTIIGVCVAVIVNGVHLPTIRHPEKVFFLRLRDIAADRYSMVPSRVMIELNRLYDEGAKICLETRWAPSFMISQMSALRINLPIIVMDGAALYDMRENEYYDMMSIPHKDLYMLRKKLLKRGFCLCLFAIRTNTMLIFHEGEVSRQELQDFENMRRSPYRNYMAGMYGKDDHVVALRILVEEGKAESLLGEMRSDPDIEASFRVVCYEMARAGKTKGLYFYRKDVSAEKMERRVLDYAKGAAGKEVEAIHIEPPKSNYDPVADAHHLIQRIGKEYMTPGLPEWKKAQAPQ